MKAISPLSVVTYATHNYRKAITKGVKKGNYALRVVGDQKKGYYLGAQRGSKIIVFSRIFTKLNKAKSWAFDRFGLVPQQALKVAA